MKYSRTLAYAPLSSVKYSDSPISFGRMYGELL